MNGPPDPTIVFAATGVPIWFCVYLIYRSRGTLREFRTPGFVMAIVLAVSTTSSMVFAIYNGSTQEWIAALILSIFYIFAANATRRW